ncbi:MAG: tetratricopeptide repeat protein [Prochloraceae cyanobacterium]|nr:tetratricopeptide repeat protein [Prochloraceae cyanobacterium]
MKEQAEIYKLFERANELWFGYECRLNEAYSFYQEIYKQNPSDPVILYQLANVFWAFEEFERAKEMISLAIENQEDLSEYGKEILAREKARLLETTSFITPLPLPPNELSLKNLQDLKFPNSDWVFISGAAEERRMFYLAICAMCSAVNDAESPRETIEWYDKNDECLDDLQLMRQKQNE